jgi:HAD superfamily hydrolase (TIGR01509 family)
MLEAVIFDCNGVIADDEPIHFELFRRVLAEEGLELSRDEYYARYLHFDDRTCFEAALRDRGRPFTPEEISARVARKAAYYRVAVADGVRIFPGARELVLSLAKRYPLAVASGARREEIALILERAGLAAHFQAVVASEDVRRAKPDPEPFLLALERLNAARGSRAGRRHSIRPDQCAVIEDSVGGVRGARAAGMRCVAVAHTYDPADLGEADLVVRSLEEITPAALERLLADAGDQRREA